MCRGPASTASSCRCSSAFNTVLLMSSPIVPHGHAVRLGEDRSVAGRRCLRLDKRAGRDAVGLVLPGHDVVEAGIYVGGDPDAALQGSGGTQPVGDFLEDLDRSLVDRIKRAPALLLHQELALLEGKALLGDVTGLDPFIRVAALPIVELDRAAYEIRHSGRLPRVLERCLAHEQDVQSPVMATAVGENGRLAQSEILLAEDDGRVDPAG